MAPAPIQYKTLDDVQKTSAYTKLGPIQKAVVRLLFFVYENSHNFTVGSSLEESLHSESSNALKTLYYTIHAHNPSSEDDILAALSKLIQFENDVFFMKKIPNEELFRKTMEDAVMLYRNTGRLPVYLPVTVLPSNEPNEWVSKERHFINSMSQGAFDAAEAVVDAYNHNNTIDQKTLVMYITRMKRELAKPFWRQLRIHAKDDQQSLDAYTLNRTTIEEALAVAEQMRDSIPPEGPTTRSRSRSKFRSRFRSRSRERQAGGKQPSKRRTMRTKKHRRRGRIL